MKPRRSPLLVGALLVVAGMALPAGESARLLRPEAATEVLAAVVAGVYCLKLLFLVDGVLLAALAWKRRRPAASMVPAPLWRPAPAQQDWMSHRAFRRALLAILALGVVLRLPGLGGDLWIDEVLTLVRFVRPTLAHLLTDFSDDNQHFLYSLLAKLSLAVFGDGPVALRLPALLAGIASLWLLVRLARFTVGPLPGLLAAALLAVSYHHVWFSQDARGYTLLLAAALLSTELFLRGVYSGRWRVWGAYALTVALGSWAHLTLVFVVLAHGLLALLLAARAGRVAGRWRALAGIAAGAWLSLHLYALVLPQMVAFFRQPAAGSTPVAVDWQSPLWLLRETAGHLASELGVGALMAPLALALLVWGLSVCARRDPVLATAMVLPGVLLGVALLVLGRSLWPRFFFDQIGFAALLMVLGALRAGQALARRLRGSVQLAAGWTPLAGLLLAMILALPGVYRYPKQDFTGARDFVRRRLGAADRVVGLHLAGRVYRLYYEPAWREVDDLAELEAARTEGARTWVLLTLPGYLRQAKPELYRRLERDFEPVATFPGTLRDGEVLVWRSRERRVRRREER